MKSYIFLINLIFFFFKCCTVYEDKIPAIGLFPVKSDLVKEYAGDILKDLPVLDEYVLWVLLRYYKTMGLFTTALVFTPILCSICVSLEMLLLWLGKVSHLCVLIKYSVNIIRKFWKRMHESVSYFLIQLFVCISLQWFLFYILKQLFWMHNL